MTTRISDVIHKWMGWCPAKPELAAPAKIQGYETKPDQGPGGRERITEGRIVDYGSTGTSLMRLILLAAGIAVIIASIMFVSLIFPFLETLMLLSILTCSAFILVYNEKNRTTIESGHANLIIHRPIFKPLIIPKDEIATAEVRDNRQPLPHWFMAATALILMPGLMIAGIYDRLSALISGGITTPLFAIYLGYIIIFTLAILSIYYHSHIRYRYPKIFVITTTGNKRLVIYAKNSEDLAELQENLL